MAKIDKEDAVMIAQELAKALKGGGFGGGPKDSPKESFSMEGLKKSLTDSDGALKSLKNEAQENVNVWRDLSKTGASFSNDLVGISTAAAGSRMSLTDFADVIKNNNKNLAGLGGSVTRGAEAFGKLSKGFFDSNMDRGLRELGYTSKDLNEVLALQAGAQKSAFSEKAGTDKMAMESAAEMAKEMDLIAKLTGKSRAEQMEAMTQKKVDGQAEAKLRLLTAGKTEEEAAKIRMEYQKGLLEAQKQGTEQSYKEFFATGTYLSEQAATQAALQGKQMRAQEESIKAMQGGDFAKAAEEREKSASEGLKNQSDKTILTLATFGSAAGTAGDVAMKNVEANDALYHSVNTVKKEYEAQHGKMISWGEALKLAKDKAVEAGAGRDKPGKPVGGAAEGAVAIEKAQQDFKAGVAGIVNATKEGGKSIGDALNDAGTVIKNSIEKISGGPKGNIGVNMADKAKAGLESEGKPFRARREGEGQAGYEEAKRQAGGGIIGTTTRLGNEAANTGVGLAAKGINEMVGPNNPLGPMDKGVPKHGEGGIIKGPELAVIAEQGPEAIIPLDKLHEVMPKPPALDLSKISKDIKTTVSSSSPGGNIPNPMSAMAKMGLNDNQRKMFEEFEKLSSDQLKEKKEALEAEKELQHKLNKEAAAARDIIEEKLENEGKTIKDLAGEDKKRFDELTKQMNDSFDASIKASDASKALKRLEGERKTDEMFNKVQAVEEAKIAEKEKLAIVEKANEDVKQTLTAHQQTVLKYAYEGEAWQEDNAKNLLKSEQSQLAEKQNTLAELQKEYEGKELNSRQKNRLELLQLDIENSKDLVKIREEELYVYQNLDKLKAKSTKETAAVVEKAAADIKENLGEAVEPSSTATAVDDEWGDLAGAQKAASERQASAAGASGGIDLNKINLPGMESFGFKAAPKDPKGADVKGAGAAAAEEAKKAEAKKAEEKKKAEQAKAAGAPAASGSAASAGAKPDKSATLNDVVKSLDQLNMQMGQLIGQQENLIRKQTSTMLSAGSNNVYEKTR